MGTDVINFLVKLVPIAALIVAWMGLSTWKRQIKGTDKYRVASDLLLEIYRLREGIKAVRSSFVEYSPVHKEGESKEMADFNGYVETMDRRWKSVSEPIAEVSLLKLKSEVYLDKNIKGHIDELMKKVRELQVTLEMYLDHRRPGSDLEFDREGRKILWAKPTDDKFNDDVEKIIAQIENSVRGYLD